LSLMPILIEADLFFFALMVDTPSGWLIGSQKTMFESAWLAVHGVNLTPSKIRATAYFR
jgi:hypothetical protein